MLPIRAWNFWPDVCLGFQELRVEKFGGSKGGRFLRA